MAQPTTVLPYMGGKKTLARRIADLLPEARLYVEPFAGMASVYMAREPISRVNILNDRDERVINFLRVNRDTPDALAAWLEQTPWSRAEYVRALPQDHPDPVIRAGQTALVCIISIRSSPGGSEPNSFGLDNDTPDAAGLFRHSAIRPPQTRNTTGSHTGLPPPTII